MKSLLFSLLMIGFFLPVSSQKLSPKTKGYLDSTFVVLRNVHGLPKVTQHAVNGLKKGLRMSASNGVFHDSLVYYTLRMEKLALQHKTKGVWDDDMVKQARAKAPGNSSKAVAKRLDIYAGRKR
ncbi:MAG: hypothetical protein AAF587_04095 [Bacteroidota bacterium]